MLVGSVNAGEYFVSIGATWCPGCIKTKARFKELRIPLTYYDVDEEPDSKRWLIGDSIPQTVRVKDGKIIDRWIGDMSYQKIKEFTK